MNENRPEIKVEYVSTETILPYVNNARNHGDADVDAIMASIREFGFNDPIGVWKNIIVEGHGRLLAAKRLGMEMVPVIRLDHLTDEQRKAYALANNKTAELSGWNFEILESELLNLADFDMGAFGFNGESIKEDFFQSRQRFDTSRQDGNDEYNDFLNKFEQKKTTDDCYTPDKVYDAVADWVANEYGVNHSDFVRPFYPGGDYKNFNYSSGAVVVDNPPFSILSEILKFYAENKIKFFLFAPTLTLFSSSSSSSCAIAVGVPVIYENGARVDTSFLTNLENDRLRSAPDLYKAVKRENEETQAEFKSDLPSYKYPPEVVTSTEVALFSKYGQEFRVSREESKHVRALDEMKAEKKAIYGSGYLVGEAAAAQAAAAQAAAAQAAAAQAAAAVEWKLSDREWEIVRNLA